MKGLKEGAGGRGAIRSQMCFALAALMMGVCCLWNAASQAADGNRDVDRPDQGGIPSQFRKICGLAGGRLSRARCANHHRRGRGEPVWNRIGGGDQGRDGQGTKSVVPPVLRGRRAYQLPHLVYQPQRAGPHSGVVGNIGKGAGSDRCGFRRIHRPGRHDQFCATGQ